jgi:hypothetical protein
MADLFEGQGGELGERMILYAVTDLDRVTANFAVFDVALAPNRHVEHHRDFFPAVGAGKGVFHQTSMLQQGASHSFAKWFLTARHPRIAGRCVIKSLRVRRPVRKYPRGGIAKANHPLVFV